MYSAETFKFIDELIGFLNKHNIKKENIIKIAVRDKSHFHPYVLIYCK